MTRSGHSYPPIIKLKMGILLHDRSINSPQQVTKNLRTYIIIIFLFLILVSISPTTAQDTLTELFMKIETHTRMSSEYAGVDLTVQGEIRDELFELHSTLFDIQALLIKIKDNTR